MSQRSVVLPVLAAMGSIALMAADVTETFETGTAVGDRPADWTGYCAVSNQVGAYAKATPGTPVVGDHTKVLWVEGSAVRTYSESNGRVVDLLVMAEELPDEELPAADGDEQIKFAFDTNGCINLYHKVDTNSVAQWSKLSDVPFEAGTWVRTTFTFDYDSKMCQLKVDGSPYVSAAGYRSPSSRVHPGSWYYLAKSNAAALTKIDFVGCGGVDDVVNAASTTYTPVHSGDTATNGVDYAWYDKNGLAWSDGSEAAPGGSGYTLKESFQTGTDPYAAEKLYVTNASYSTTELVFTINGYGKTYSVETNATPFTDGTAGTAIAATTIASDEAANTTTLQVPFPAADGVTYYRVRSGAATAAETVNQFAIMKITSSTANTLVSLPWKSLSANVANPAAITAANVVMNNNLVDGDWLLYYDGGYKGWCLTGGVWEPTGVADLNGIAVTAAPANAELARGQAIWLVRPGSRDLSQPFYLYGQYQQALGSATVVSGGSLMACPDANTAFTVSASKISGAANGDRIVVPATDGTSLPKVFECRDGVWGTVVETASGVGPDGKPMTDRTWTTSGAVMNIPAGSGFMYQGTGTPTFNW